MRGLDLRLLLTATLLAFATLPAAHAAAEDTAPVAAAAPAPALRIAFVGDSMVDGLWGSFERVRTKQACWSGAVELGRFAKNSTGLTRADSYDWVAKVKDAVDNFKPDLVIVQLGANDRQGIVDADGSRTPYPGETFAAKYRERIAAFLANATSGGAKVVWVGLPPMRDPKADADAADKNRIFADAVAAFGKPDSVIYVDPVTFGEGEKPAFQSFIKDPRGLSVQVRAPDGVHFTAYGYDLVSNHVYDRISHSIVAGRIPSATCAAN